MKRIVAVFLTIILILLSAFATADSYIVNTDSEPLRIRDAETGEILGQIRKGKTINIDSTDNYWAYFDYKGIRAKVYKEYLTPSNKKGNSFDVTVSEGNASNNQSKPKVTIDDASIICKVSDTKVKHFISVRKTKNDNGTIIGKLYPNDEVYVIAIGNVWARIVYDGDYGFVKADYLVLSDINLPEEGELYRIKVKNGQTVNIRAKPSTKKGKIVHKLPNGALVKVTEMKKSWAFIFFSMRESGYVMNKFLSKVN